MLDLGVTRNDSFVSFFEGGVDFGAPYLGNYRSYRSETGPNGLGLKKTIFLGGFENSKIVTLAY